MKQNEQITNSPEPPVTSPTARLFSAGTISLFTVLTAFPVGYALAIINWHRMGNDRKKRSYIFGLVSSCLFAILLIPYTLQIGLGYTIINIAFGIQFYNEMTFALNAYELRGNQYRKESFWSGCLIGTLTFIAWAVIIAILSSAIIFFSELLFSV